MTQTLGYRSDYVGKDAQPLAYFDEGAAIAPNSLPLAPSIPSMNSTRRDFLKHTVVASAAFSIPSVWTSAPALAQHGRRRDRLKLAAIGVGGSRGAWAQGTSIAMRASQFADMIAVCDVDQVHMAEFNAKFDNKLKLHQDYRKLLEQQKPDVVTIGTPDHWHVPIAIAALQAGCNVYCEKPLTLTIEEGYRIREVVKETGRTFQVGTQQRSEHGLLFLKAIAVVQSGRLGKQVNADIAIGGGMVGGPFKNIDVPSGLDWDMWVGPANKADYSPERGKEFRWYFDYSGGKMTDWGAHHVDIAQWALGHQNTGPVKLSLNGPHKFTPIVPENFDWQAYLAGQAALPNGYHTPTKFSIRMEYADGSTITVHDEYVSEDGKTKFPNGILFTGENGRIFVNRERLTGKSVEDMTKAEKSSMLQAMIPIYKGRWPGDHMGNFFDCIKEQDEPISDVNSHVRTMNSCHLCNIALMLGRDLNWDPNQEKFVDDERAAAFVSRHRRDAYSLAATTAV
jgi:predicted dehydrogenase